MESASALSRLRIPVPLLDGFASSSALQAVGETTRLLRSSGNVTRKSSDDKALASEISVSQWHELSDRTSAEKIQNRDVDQGPRPHSLGSPSEGVVSQTLRLSAGDAVPIIG